MAKQKLTQHQKDLNANEKKFRSQTKRSLKNKGVFYIDNLINYYKDNEVVDESLVSRENALTIIESIKAWHLYELKSKQKNPVRG